MSDELKEIEQWVHEIFGPRKVIPLYPSGYQLPLFKPQYFPVRLKDKTVWVRELQFHNKTFARKFSLVLKEYDELDEEDEDI